MAVGRHDDQVYIKLSGHGDDDRSRVAPSGHDLAGGVGCQVLLYELLKLPLGDVLGEDWMRFEHDPLHPSDRNDVEQEERAFIGIGKFVSELECD